MNQRGGGWKLRQVDDSEMRPAIGWLGDRQRGVYRDGARVARVFVVRDAGAGNRDARLA